MYEILNHFCLIIKKIFLYIMELNEFQETVKNYVLYPRELGPFYHILSMTTDIGKLSESLRTKLEEQSDFNDRERLMMAITLGNILYSIASIASNINMPFDQIAALSITKKQHELQEKIDGNT